MTRILKRLLALAVIPMSVAAMSSSAAAGTGWQAAGHGDVRFHCGATSPQDLSVYGQIHYQECLIVTYTQNGAYFQGLLSAYWDGPQGTTETFTGSNWAMLEGTDISDSYCGSVTVSRGVKEWCFTPTRFVAGHGRPLTASGYILPGLPAKSPLMYS